MHRGSYGKKCFHNPDFPTSAPLLWGKLFGIFFILALLMIACIISLMIYQTWTVYVYALIYLIFSLLSFHNYILIFPFIKIISLISVMKTLCLVSHIFLRIFFEFYFVRKYVRNLILSSTIPDNFKSPFLFILSCSYNQDFLALSLGWFLSEN